MSRPGTSQGQKPSSLRSRTRAGSALTNGDAASRTNANANRPHERKNSNRLRVGKVQTQREPALLQPTQGKALRRDGLDATGAVSEADSLVELYGGHASVSPAAGVPPRANGTGANRDLYLDEDEDPERSRWIHRDKLARIEIEEMQRAGIYVGPINRRLIKPSVEQQQPEEEPQAQESESESESESDERATERRQSPPSAVPLATTPDFGYDGYEEEERRQSTARMEAHDEDRISFELRRPEEVAAEANEEVARAMAQNRRLVRKPSWSKIPLSKSSPIPVPQDFIEKNTPTPRSRSGAFGGLDEQSIEYRRVRNRSTSVGSQNLLDQHEEGVMGTPTPAPRPSTQDSPPESKDSGRRPSSSYGRGAPGTRDASGQQKPRPRTGPEKNSPAQRPVTRSGETPPRPINRPEGDPPWLATMYKPDPRLPQEEQLLPTVAKRLQREQWEREGKPVPAVELDFEPVATDRVRSPKPEPRSKPTPSPPADFSASNPRDEWPLRSPDHHSGRRSKPAETRSDRGDRMPPPIEQQQQQQQQPRQPRQSSPAAAAAAKPAPAPAPAPKPTPDPSSKPSIQPPSRPLRVQEPVGEEQEKEAKAGCRCCVVM